ncbi:MAG TPA: DUF2231 domain-containing protein [Pyrinomonadaceae bacterium]|jgi:uncharacterized membrane protein|nr:DUF2231 domain-containing protein [Pyrinomonadaceae bacterium]
MESRARIFGHAIHPILIVYPLGLLSAAVVFDIVYLVTGNPLWTTVSYWMIFAGIIGGLLAAVFGLIDFLYIPSKTRAKRIGLLHGLVNLGVVILFIGSCLLRWSSPGVPSNTAFALSFIGVGAALLGGWLGGELVERLGVSVTPGANLNAPNSLTHGARETKRASGQEGTAAV